MHGIIGWVSDPSWTDAVVAISSVLTPFVLVVVGVALAKRQSRNDELVKVRLDYYRLIAPDLNLLMCYMTFIGTWRDLSPIDIIAAKRRLDTNFFCAAPLFSRDVSDAYKSFMSECFAVFGDWGQDARIKTNPYRRRLSWKMGSWLAEWDAMFSLPDSETVTVAALRRHRQTYDILLAALVRDIEISKARDGYTTDQVTMNAHAPSQQEVSGAPQ